MFFSFLHFLKFHMQMQFQGIFNRKLSHNFNSYQDAYIIIINKYHITANFLYYFLISAYEAELSISKIPYKSETSPWPKFNLYILRNFSSIYLLKHISKMNPIRNAEIYTASYPVFLFPLCLTLILVFFSLVILLLLSCDSYFYADLLSFYYF